MEDFQGVDTSTSRPGVDDKKCAWIDGFIPLDRMNLRTLPGIGPKLWAPTGFTGSGATGHVTMTGFNVASIVITNGGQWATPGNAHWPYGRGTFALGFSGGGGVGVAATGTVDFYQSNANFLTISSVNLTNQGSGYTSAPSIVSINGVALTFLTPPTMPVLTAVLGTEQVASIVLDTGGSGYSGVPTVTITGGSPAVAATAHATVVGGTVTALILDTPGSGYLSTPTVEIQSASKSGAIIYPKLVTLGTTSYLMAITADGSLWAVNTQTGGSSIIGQNIITNPAIGQMAITQWGNQGAIIVANQTNGYWVWDGTTFFKPGDTAPSFGNPVVNPPITTMPTGVQGQAVETYNGQVWITKGTTLLFSAPGSIIDFTTANGGGSQTSNASYTRISHIQPVSANGFLYLVNDSSVDYVSGVTTGGTPTTTTFTYQNVDPENGSPWPGSVNIWDGNIVFANPFGIQIAYGSRVTKISKDLDGVYNTVPNFGGFLPSSAKATIFGKKVFILLLPIVDPVTGQPHNTLIMWNGKEWWTSSQEIEFTYICHQEINSVFTAYGTDGNAVYPLFQQPSTGFTKTVQSKLWSAPGGYQFHKASGRLWGLAQYYSFLSPNLTVEIDNETATASQTLTLGPNSSTWTNAGGATATWTNAGGATATWFGAGTGAVVFPPTAVGQFGALTGLTITTQAADMALTSLMLGDEVVSYRG